MRDYFLPAARDSHRTACSLLHAYSSSRITWQSQHLAFKMKQAKHGKGVTLRTAMLHSCVVRVLDLTSSCMVVAGSGRNVTFHYTCVAAWSCPIHIHDLRLCCASTLYTYTDLLSCIAVADRFTCRTEQLVWQTTWQSHWMSCLHQILLAWSIHRCSLQMLHASSPHALLRVNTS